MLPHHKIWVGYFSKLLYTKNKGKDDQNLFLYNDTDRNIRNAILDSPFTSKEIVKGATLLKSKKTSDHDSISNEMIKASLSSSSSFLVILFNKVQQTHLYLAE